MVLRHPVLQNGLSSRRASGLRDCLFPRSSQPYRSCPSHQINLAVRIGPYKFRDDSLYRDARLLVVRRVRDALLPRAACTKYQRQHEGQRVWGSVFISHLHVPLPYYFLFAVRRAGGFSWQIPLLRTQRKKIRGFPRQASA